MLARWRPAVRIALRSARRHPGRTVLVAALVVVPVLGTAFLDTAYRTAELDPGTDATRAMGAADATLIVTPTDRVVPVGTSWTDPPEARPRDPAAVDPARFLPTGTRMVPRRPESTVSIVTGDRTARTRAAELEWTDPAAAGLLSVREGRLAAAPGELTLSPALAHRLGVRIGQDVRPAGLAAQQVVGLAADPACRSCELAAGPPGWTGGPAALPDNYLLDLPAGVPADQALQARLARSGLFLLPRDAYLHPDRWAGPGGSTGADPTLLAVAVLVAGLGLLEVVLLAGTAFAVAARRQARDAALLLANGGRRADVRRLLLAQGAVLGTVGAVSGSALGVLAVVAGRRPLEALVDQDFGRLVVSPLDLVVTALAGVLAGVAAAVVPAWSAGRVPVVAALAGRRPPAPDRHRPAAAAVVAAVAGLAVAGVVAQWWAHARRDGTTSLAYPVGLVLGFGLTMVALTVLAPSLVGVAGRLAGQLRLTGRLALRDAARHRHRTGPAVGAVMVAVAGSVAVAFAVASYDQRDRDRYEPSLPLGWASVLVSTPDAGFGRVADQVAAVRSAASELPAGAAVPLESAQPPVGADGSTGFAQALPAGDCPVYSGTLGVGEPTARFVAGPLAADAAAALAAGKAVVTDPCLVSGGAVRVDVQRPGPASADPSEQLADVPAVVLQRPGWSGLPATVLPVAAARRLGLLPQTYQVVLPTSRMPTAGEEDRFRTALGPLGTMLQVERGYGAPYLPGFVALMGGAGLVTLAGVAISVTLSAAEGRADLATLAAIGAPPRRRRGLAMVQAALVAGLGVGLGLLLGAAVGVTILSGLDGYPLVVPWLPVLVIGLGVPVLGVLATGALTRSRLPMVRRLG